MSWKKELSSFTTKEQFADWLLALLIDFHQTPSRKKSQNEFYRFIVRENFESSLQAIAYICRDLSVDQLVMLHQGIGCALTKCAQEDDIAFDVINDLIYLICFVKAKETEVLDGLLVVLTKKDNNILVYNSLSVVMSFQPSEMLFNFISSLIQIPHFDDAFIFEAIKIMAECKPEMILQIVDNLSLRIANLYKKTKDALEEDVYWEAVYVIFDKNDNKAIIDKIVEYSKVG